MKRLNATKTLMVLAISAASSANAAYVDGIVSAGEYAGGTTLNLGFADEQHKTANPIQGSFSYIVEGNYIYAALSAPTDFVDNVYGAPADADGSGWWGTASYEQTNKDGTVKLNKDGTVKIKTKDIKGHSFKQLLGSDKLEFDLTTKTGTSSVNFDYLIEDSSAPGGYRAKIDDGSEVIQQLATSLEYNLSLGTGVCGGSGDDSDSADYVTDASLDSRCSKTLTYEWRMDATQFDLASFSAANFLNPTMHASPSKIGTHSFNPDCKNSGNTLSDCPTTTTNSIPEPGSLALLFAGLAGLGWTRRFKKS